MAAKGIPPEIKAMRAMADFVLAACLLASVPTVGTGAESAQQSSQADSASVQAAVKRV